ncbi:ribose-5-phosphate isomerase RpiA [Bombilactobacillus folatiphilus]|uniref:Ribose-5-phosphate isomerase A n=1 Tax=Bombilactobacillus folatiphilus TaxID=2923362 RepID=A0ABY4P9L2_9LACO|nr:ribose-5-phosphate isomerase RpiA [Bombilactobacillus folatiphilus]UQS82399.1 ribose-5-phosphate isomerase RpiA [Bombilactobacillus folatiphilus]
MTQSELKQTAAIKAADAVHNDMTIGLGTGSTVYYLVEELGRRVQEDKLQIDCASTSKRTFEQAQQLGIRMHPLSEMQTLDLTIDGADEIDAHFQGIKGGGAALTYEKIVALNSKHNLWIVDQTKLVSQLGAFPLPLEVNPFGCQQLIDRLTQEGLHPKLRYTQQKKLVKTDMNNYIVDLHLEQIKHPHLLADWLDHQSGIIEHGLFLDLVNEVVVGQASGPKVIAEIR